MRCAKLISRNSGSTEEEIDGQDREYTICFRMPNAGQYYASLMVHPFQGWICDWTGSVFDSYILHSCTADSPFIPLNFLLPLWVIYESDEEDGIADRIGKGIYQ